MKIVFVNGTREELEWREMRQFFWHPHFVTLVLALSGIVVALRPYDDMVDLSVMRLTIFYANAVLCFVFTLVTSVYLVQLRGKTVYSQLHVIGSVCTATIYGMHSSTLLGAATPSWQSVLLVILFNLVFGLLGEVILVSYLLRPILRDVRRHASVETGTAASTNVSAPTMARAATAPFTALSVHILNADFLLSEILALSAEAHYVAVHLKSGQKKLLRGRISDAAGAMPENAGRLIHRSHWVAGWAVEGVEADARQTMVVLVDGSRFPVARTKVAELRDWLGKCPARKKAP